MTQMRRTRRRWRRDDERVLRCETCALATEGPAELWIALLVPGNERNGVPDVAIYCPRCAESQFQFYSQRQHRLSE